MRKIVALALAISSVFAEENCYYGYTSFCEGGKHYIFADVANVRTQPSREADIAHKFEAGLEIVITSLDGGRDEKIENLQGLWIKVATTDNSKREGWIWSNSLSSTQLRRGNVKFVFGFDKREESTYFGTIKAVDNGVVADRKVFKVNEGMASMAINRAEIIDSVYLTNVEQVVFMNFGGNACATPDSDIYYAWSGKTKKLTALPEVMSISDAGAFSHSETLLIPAKNRSGIHDMLIKVTESGEAVDNCDNCDYKWEYSSELYKWNGQKAVLVGK